MNEQEKTWAGEFGNEYTTRNRVDWWARVPFWARIMTIAKSRSVFEFGCNAGWNLLAIRALGFPAELTGCDVNPRAIAEARSYGLQTFVGSPSSYPDHHRYGSALEDLVFTAGVLIHVHPKQLLEVMRSIKTRARRHVLAVEYDSHEEEMVEYRGKVDLLWKRPYGDLYQALDLKLIDRIENPPGFDRCTAWLLEKP